MISRAAISGVVQGQPKYRSMLAGNTAFSPNAYESIATATGAGTTITLSSIPATYTHLQLRINYSRDSGNSSIAMRMNGDTSSIYTYVYFLGNNTNTPTYLGNSTSQITDMGIAYGGPTARGSLVVDILNYANTSMWKTTRTIAGSIGGGNSQTQYHTGLWASTAAITSLTFNIGGDTFSADTQIALYGIKGV
jgi:hypothetical protein